MRTNLQVFLPRLQRELIAIKESGKLYGISCASLGNLTEKEIEELTVHPLEI